MIFFYYFRLQFQPYNHNQLQSIVSARLADTDAFNSDAVQLVARYINLLIMKYFISYRRITNNKL